MSAADIIEQVQKLQPGEVFQLGKWLREYEAELWDRQIESDIRSGKLEQLGEKAVAELRAGKTTPFPK